MIAIVDYGAGNLKSILKAVEKAGGKAVVTSERVIIESADAIILPGVGAFETAIRNMGPISEYLIKADVPVLGICLGMQLFADESEEGGLHKGLGIIRGRVIRFPDRVGKIPHMGWNLVIATEHPLFEEIKEGYFYFVHSYYFKTAESNVIGVTEYGIEFPSAVARDNIMGVQFHPEKSGKNGLRVLENFVSMI